MTNINLKNLELSQKNIKLIVKHAKLRRIKIIFFNFILIVIILLKN